MVRKTLDLNVQFPNQHTFLRGPGAYSPRKWFGFKLSKVLFGGFLTHSKKSDQLNSGNWCGYQLSIKAIRCYSVNVAYLFQYHSMPVEFVCYTCRLLYLGRNSKSQSRELSDLSHECYKPVSIVDSQFSIPLIQVHQAATGLQASRKHRHEILLKLVGLWKHPTEVDPEADMQGNLHWFHEKV